MKEIKIQTPWQRTLEPYKQFAKDSRHFWNKCEKPRAREVIAMSVVVATLALTLGFIGFGIRLIHIPIHHILIGS